MHSFQTCPTHLWRDLQHASTSEGPRCQSGDISVQARQLRNLQAVLPNRQYAGPGACCAAAFVGGQQQVAVPCGRRGGL